MFGRASARLRIACILKAHDLLLLLNGKGAHDVPQLLIAPRKRSGLQQLLNLRSLHRPVGPKETNGASPAYYLFQFYVIPP
jgi:hypothetical protein